MSSTEEEVPIEATSPLHTDSTYEAGPPPEEEWAQNPPSGPNTVQTRGVPAGEDASRQELAHDARQLEGRVVMPLPDPEARPVQADAGLGVGLRAVMQEQRMNRPPTSWPERWWQQNYDLLLEPQGAEPIPLSGRQLQIPPPP